MNRSLQRLLYILLGLGIGFGLSLLLLACLPLYLNTGHGQAFGKRLINRHLSGKIDWQEMHLSVYRGSVAVRKLRLEGPHGDNLAGLDDLKLSWSWPALFRGQLVIQGDVEKPWARLHQDRDGKLNLTKALSITAPDAPGDPNGSWLPLNLVVDSFRLVEGSLQFRESSDRLLAEINGIGLTFSGNLAEESVNAELDFSGGRFAFQDFRTPLKPSSLKARYIDNRIEPIHLSISTGAGEITLNGTIENPFDSPLLDVKANMSAALEKIVPVSDPAAAFTGIVQAHINIEGRLDNPVADLQLSYEGGTVSGQLIDNLNSRVALADRLLTIDRLGITTDTDELQLNGQVDLKPVFTRGFFDPDPDFKLAMVDADFSIQAPNLGASLAPLGITAAKGAVAANGKVTGTFHQPQFDLRFDGSKLEYEDIRLGDIRLAADLDSRGRLRIGELSVNNRGSVIQGKGEIQVLTSTRKLESNPPLNLELTLTDVEARDFVDQELARGKLGGKVKLTGSMQNPLGRLNLEGRSIGIGDYAIGDVTAALTYQNGTLVMETVKLVNGGTRVNITGNTRILEPGTFKLIGDPVIDVAVTGKDIRIEDYFPEWKGQFSLEARLNGPLKHPRGPISVHGQKIASPWQYVDRLDLAARFEGDTLRVDQLAVSPAPDEWIRMSGRVSPDALSDVRIVTEGISLAHIGLLKEKIPAEGKLAVTLEGNGPFGNPTAAGTVTLKEFKAGGKSLDDLRGDVNLEDRKVSFDFQHGAIGLTGAYHLVQKYFSMNSRIHADDLGPYFILFGLADFGGRIQGEFQAEGDLDNLDQLVVSGKLSNARLDFKGQEMLRTNDARLTYDHGRFRIPGWDLILLDRGNLHIEGFGRPGGDIELVSEGTLPLAVGRMLVPRLHDLSGDLRLSATVKGKWTRPEVRGHITIQSGALTIPVWGQKLYGINGTFALQPDAITIHGLRGKLDEGDINLFGTLNLDHFLPGEMNLAFSITNLPLRIPDRLDVFINSELELAGTPDNSRLKGNIDLLDGTYYKDVLLNPMDMLKQKKTRAMEPKPPDVDYPYLKNLALNVEISTRNPFLVENNLAELDIVSDIQILGKLNQPEFIGRIDIPDGTVGFWNRKFQVTRGSIDFVDPYSIRPDIDIRAETEIRQWIVYVDVTGSIDNPELELSSNPSEESGDILALILTGRTSWEMIAGEGGRSNSTGVALGALAGTPLGKEILTATGIDTLEMDTITDDVNNRENTRVTFGRDLSDRMTLKYSMETKEGELVHKTIAEYQLLENILVSGFQDNNGIYGGALRYRIEFR